MKNLINLKKNPLPAFSLGTFLVFVISGVLIFTNYHSLGETLLIKFDHLSGFLLFGGPVSIWHIWFAGLAVSAINLLLGFSFFYRERAAAYFLGGAGFFVSLVILGIVGVILSVN